MKLKKIKWLWNSNCDETQKIKLWWNSKTQIVMKLQNSNCDETQKLKLWWNSKTQIVMKLKNSKCDKTQKLKLWAIISFSILGVKWYGKPYYFGNAGYAFPYLLEATNITKPIFLSIPKPSHTPRPPPLGILLGIHVFLYWI